jgi:hypothetical protein
MMYESRKISDIADDLEMGLRCFVHKKNGTKICIPQDEQLDYLDAEDEWQEEIKYLKRNKKHYFEIENMESRESFTLMARFADKVPDPDIQYRLRKALQGKNPFQNFKLSLDRDDHYRKEWFQFKRLALKEWIERQLKIFETH